MKKKVVTSLMLATMALSSFSEVASVYAIENEKVSDKQGNSLVSNESTIPESSLSTEQTVPRAQSSTEESSTEPSKEVSSESTNESEKVVTPESSSESDKTYSKSTEATKETSDETDGKKTDILDVPNVKYKTHVQNIGWQNYELDGDVAGTSGRSLRLEAIKIGLIEGPLVESKSGIEYQTHVQNIGWQNYVSDEQESGTSGRSLRLEGIKIRLTGEIAKNYDVHYRVHIQDKGWLNWAKNGEASGSQGASKRLEAIQIKLVKKGEKAPSGSGKAFLVGNEAKRPDEIKPNINYQTHVQNIGWQNYVKNGAVAGTSGRSLRLEGIRINLSDKALKGGVEYSTHIQNVGWQKFASNNGLSGTTGRSLRLEGIKIRLTGDVAKYYDVYYRVHIQDKGWLNWAKNGASAGSQSASKRLEAIQIQVVRKGEKAPSGSGKAFLVGDEARTWKEIQARKKAEEARKKKEAEAKRRTERLRARPVYYSQRDYRWSGVYIGRYSMGDTGCVPTSLAMVLQGNYKKGVMPLDVARTMSRLGGYNQSYYGASATDLRKTVNYYGRSMRTMKSKAEMVNYLKEGYPIITFQNVGIGHAVVLHGYSNGRTEVFDPYNRQFYSGWVSTDYLWGRPSTDPIDWSEGRPFFAIL